MKKKAPWWHSWRHVAAYMYLFICMFDFVAMPIYYELAHSPLSKTQLVSLVATMDSVNQVQAMQIISAEQRWEPLTLGETGLFHMAFGAILGVAAFSRGRERRSRPGYFDSESDSSYGGGYGGGSYGGGSYGGGSYGGGGYGSGEYFPSEEEAPSRNRGRNRTPNPADPFSDPETK